MMRELHRNEKEKEEEMEMQMMQQQEEEEKEGAWLRGLPQPLVERILASLPLACLARLRLLSKQWNTLASSPSFAKLRSQLPHPETWFISKCGDEKPAIFDPSLGKFHRLLSRPPLDLVEERQGYVIAATAGGFVLLELQSQSPSPTAMVVWNPITGLFRKLPPSRHRLSAHGFVYHEDTDSYEIVLFDCGSEWTTEIYDSTAKRWTSSTGGKDYRRRIMQSGAVWFMERFYCVLDGVLRTYDVKKGLWSEAPAEPIPASNCVYASVPRCNGSLLAIQVDFGVCFLQIWEFHLLSESSTWLRGEMLPNGLCLELWNEELERFHSFELMRRNEELYFVYSFVDFKVLVYNRDTRSWFELDPRREKPAPERHWPVTLPFEPSFSSSP